MNSAELAKRICDCLSDGNDSFIKAVLIKLCECVEELEG